MSTETTRSFEGVLTRADPAELSLCRQTITGRRQKGSSNVTQEMPLPLVPLPPPLRNISQACDMVMVMGPA